MLRHFRVRINTPHDPLFHEHTGYTYDGPDATQATVYLDAWVDGDADFEFVREEVIYLDPEEDADND